MTSAKRTQQFKPIRIKIIPVAHQRVRLVLNTTRERGLVKKAAARLRRLGPSGRRFYRRELLQLRVQRKKQGVSYIGNPWEFAKAQHEALATAERRQRQKFREHLVELLEALTHRKESPRPIGHKLPNGIPSVRYDPLQVHRAYFSLYHHPHFHPLARRPPTDVCEQSDSNNNVEEGEVFDLDCKPLRGIPDNTSSC